MIFTLFLFVILVVCIWIIAKFHFIIELDENEVERSDDTKASKNEDIRLRLGSLAQSHSQNHQQYRLNNASSHKNYKGKYILSLPANCRYTF